MITTAARGQASRLAAGPPAWVLGTGVPEWVTAARRERGQCVGCGRPATVWVVWACHGHREEPVCDACWDTQATADAG